MKQMLLLFILINSLLLKAQSTQNQPNIIWIVCEDISPYMGSYGDPIIRTPNIDELSSQSVRYTRVYTTAGVCAPSRSSMITGMHQIAIGTQHMRTRSVNPIFKPEGLPDYWAVLPEEVRAFPEYLRKEGYYTSNNHKEDYQFEEPVTVWDESSPAASYRNRAEDQPFFSVFNFARTHESQMMRQQDSIGYDPTKMQVPMYLQDTEITRKDLALLYTRIEEMDAQVGALIAQLKEDGVYENSYVFFFSDHGGVMPWTKRAILERGTHIPFIVKFPEGQNAGNINNDLISAVDFAPSVLSIAGINPPEYMHGKAFLGDYSSESQNKYVFASSDRFDEKYDRIRSVSDGSFRYVYNFQPHKPKYMDLGYRKGIRTMKEILERKENNEISNPYLLDWFAHNKPVEELYYTLKDSDEVHNLAEDPHYQTKKEELKSVLFEWLNRVGDLSDQSEIEMVRQWWNGKDIPPVTAEAKITLKRGKATIECETPGASIGYRIQRTTVLDSLEHQIKSWDFYSLRAPKNASKTMKVPKPWKVYTGGELELNKGDVLIVNTHRIGYQPSIKYLKY